MHTIFFCDISRATWRASEIGLRVDHIPLSFPTAFLHITEVLKTEEVTTFANIVWCIWKARNEALYTTKRPTPASTLKQVCTMKVSIGTGEKEEQGEKQRGGTPQIMEVLKGTEVVLVDGSWDTTNGEGWGFTGYNIEGGLRIIRYGAVQAVDALQAEAQGLLQAFTHIRQIRSAQPTTEFAIYSDCQILVKAVQENSIKHLPAWRTASIVAECGRHYQACKDYTGLKKTARETLRDPHQLANWARRTRKSFDGTSNEAATLNLTLRAKLDMQHFAWREPSVEE